MLAQFNFGERRAQEHATPFEMSIKGRAQKEAKLLTYLNVFKLQVQGYSKGGCSCILHKYKLAREHKAGHTKSSSGEIAVTVTALTACSCGLRNNGFTKPHWN